MDGLLCCPFMCLTHSCHGTKEADVLFMGDSGIDYWGYRCGQPFCCCVSEVWKELRDGLRSMNLVNVGACSAPACAVCCYAPCAIKRYRPKKYIVVQAGSNELVYWPLPGVGICLLKAGCNFPHCSHDWFMRWVGKYAEPDVQVIVVPDYIGHHVAPCCGFRQYWEQVRASSGVVITPTRVGDDYTTFDVGAAWEYERLEQPNAKHPRAIYVDVFPAYDKLKEANPKAFTKQMGNCEATADNYRYSNEFLQHIIGGSNGSENVISVAWGAAGEPKQQNME